MDKIEVLFKVNQKRRIQMALPTKSLDFTANKIAEKPAGECGGVKKIRLSI
jgi:hypothetical protein